MRAIFLVLHRVVDVASNATACGLSLHRPIRLAFYSHVTHPSGRQMLSCCCWIGWYAVKWNMKNVFTDWSKKCGHIIWLLVSLKRPSWFIWFFGTRVSKAFCSKYTCRLYFHKLCKVSPRGEQKLFSFYCAMLRIVRTMLSQDVCPSVTHTPLLCRNGKNFITLFTAGWLRHSCFPCQTLRQIFGNTPTGPHIGDVEYRGYEKSRFSTNVSLYLGNDTR